MRKMLIVFALVSSVVVLAPVRAWACSCAPSTNEEARRGSAIVFAGTLSDIRGPLITMGGNRTISYLFEVDTVVKGKVHERVVMDNLIDEHSTCSGELHRGSRYLVFGQNETRLRYDVCSPTHNIGDRQIEGFDPLPGGPRLPPDPQKLILAGAAVAAVGGYLLYRRFRDPLKV